MGVVIVGLLVVLVHGDQVDLVVLGRADEVLLRLGLHLLLDLVPRLVVKETVGVTGPGDPLHYAAVIVEILVAVDQIVEVLELVLVWDRPRGAQGRETALRVEEGGAATGLGERLIVCRGYGGEPVRLGVGAKGLFNRSF